MIALLGAGGILGVLTLAIWALLAERRAGQQRARGDVLSVRYEEMIAKNNNLEAEVKTQKGKVHALDLAIAKYASEAVGPIDGALARMLEAAQAIKADSAAPSELRADPGAPGGPPATHPTSDTDLLEPGA